MYDKETLKVDKAATETAKTEERQGRIQRGKPFDAFNEEWLQQKVDDSILKFYGTWPDAECIEPIFRP